MRNKVVFYLNGSRREVGPDYASMMLSDYLRYERGLTGTKVVCAEGDCGACNVLRSFPHDQENHYPINSCIIPVACMDGSSLITVEALQDGSTLHETQRAMAECHGSQCGFCTPGFVMALSGLVEKKIAKQQSTISETDAKNALTGNLCRCTGYQAILDAAKSINVSKCQSLATRYSDSEQTLDLQRIISEELLIQSGEYIFYAPKKLSDAIAFLKQNLEAKIIGSATDLGVFHNKHKMKLTKMLSLHLVDELYDIMEKDGEVFLGARVTITNLRNFCKGRFDELAHYIDIFASPQIKNNATVVGNIANASPIGDLPPALLALGAVVYIYSDGNEKQIKLTDFFLSYRKTELKAGEIITKISFKLPKKVYFKAMKNSVRKDLDISTVNFSAYVDEKNKEIRLAAGGIAATPLRLKKTEEFLLQNGIDQKSIKNAINVLHSEFTPLSDHRGSNSYRRVLVENYFKRVLSEYLEAR